jgi:hypothetical protein
VVLEDEVMGSFRTIEIDFDVHKKIENERTGFSESPNDALRRLLHLPQNPSPDSLQTITGRSWSDEGVSLAHGTRIKMSYNRRLYEGEILNGKWVVEGKTFDSPSGAASGIALTKGGKHTRLDGWMYWEAKQPGESGWERISIRRRNAKKLR